MNLNKLLTNDRNVKLMLDHYDSCLKEIKSSELVDFDVHSHEDLECTEIQVKRDYFFQYDQQTLDSFDEAYRSNILQVREMLDKENVIAVYFIEDVGDLYVIQ